MALSHRIGFASLVTALASYDESRALQYAKLAGAAYCPTDSLQSWSCGDFCNDVPVSSVKVCQGTATKAFVGIWEGKGLVSFQGSANILAWVRNLEFSQTTTGWDLCEDCSVHQGFLEEYNTMKSCIQSSLEDIGSPTGSTIRTTGHSLGAALNNLAMLDLDYSGWTIEEAYDFGKPRTGNAAFAAAWNSKFSDIAFRVTHHRDPVPQVPPDRGIGMDWEHVQPEIWYEDDLNSGFQECDDPHQLECAEQYWDIPFNVLFHDSVDDHLHYLDLPICDCPNSALADTVV